jgi:uncharacterized protein YbjT (DUF2867 family)
MERYELGRYFIISFNLADKREITFQKQFYAMEEHLKKSMIPYTILRTMYFMENLLMYVAEATKGKLMQPLKNAKFCPISTLDIGRCEAQILMNPKDHISKCIFESFF